MPRAAFAIVVLLLGCRREDAPPAPVEAADPVAQKLEAIRDVLARAHADAQATALHRATDEAALDSLLRECAALRAAERIPDEPGPPALAFRAELESVASEAGVALTEVSVRPRAIPRRTLPDVVHEPFEWTVDDVRNVSDVRVSVTAAGPAELERFTGALRTRLPRLLVLTRVVRGAAGFDLHGEVYTFTTPAPPRHVPLRPVLDDLLREAGLTPAQARSKAAKAALAECDHEQTWIRKVTAGAEKALVPASELGLLQAKRRFLDDRLRATASGLPGP